MASRSPGGSFNIATLGGAWPVLLPGDFGSNFGTTYAGNKMPGWVGNGDWFELPVTSTGTVYYKNSAGTILWALTPADLNAACDQWVGFANKDGLIYCLGRDTATSPDTYYLRATNVGFTPIVNSTFQMSYEFSTLGGAPWNASAPSAGATCIQFDANGDILLLNSHYQAALVDGGTGALISDPYAISPSVGGLSYFAASGNYFNYGNSSTSVVFGIGNEAHIASHNLDTVSQQLLGYPEYVASGRLLHWKDKVIHVTANGGGSMYGHRVWDKLAFDEWVDDMVLAMGIAP